MPARLPQQSGMHVRVANVRQTDANATTQRNNRVRLLGDNETETDVARHRPQQMQLAEEIRQPLVHGAILDGRQAVILAVHATGDVRHHLRLFDRCAREEMLALHVLHDDPWPLLAYICRYFEVVFVHR